METALYRSNLLQKAAQALLKPTPENRYVDTRVPTTAYIRDPRGILPPPPHSPSLLPPPPHSPSLSVSAEPVFRVPDGTAVLVRGQPAFVKDKTEKNEYLVQLRTKQEPNENAQVETKVLDRANLILDLSNLVGRTAYMYKPGAKHSTRAQWVLFDKEHSSIFPLNSLVGHHIGASVDAVMKPARTGVVDLEADAARVTG